MIKDRTIKNIRNVFTLKKQNKGIKDRIIRDIWNLFEYEEENYYKPTIVNNFPSNNYFEYKGKDDRRALSIYLNKIKPYLKDIINDLKKYDTSKIQLTITINFISSCNEFNL